MFLLLTKPVERFVTVASDSPEKGWRNLVIWFASMVSLSGFDSRNVNSAHKGVPKIKITVHCFSCHNGLRWFDSTGGNLSG